MAAALVQQLEESGLPLLDMLGGMHLDSTENRLETDETGAQQISSRVSLTSSSIPPRTPPNSRAITPDWRCRVSDYHTFMDEEIRSGTFGRSAVHVIGYRALKDLMPSA